MGHDKIQTPLQSTTPICNAFNMVTHLNKCKGKLFTSTRSYMQSDKVKGKGKVVSVLN
jgi:hypothetical protein